MSTPTVGSPGDGRAFIDGAALSLPVTIDSTHNQFKYNGVDYVLASGVFRAAPFETKLLCRVLRDAVDANGDALGDLLDIHHSPFVDGALRFTATDAGVNTDAFATGTTNDCLARLGITNGATLGHGATATDPGVTPDPALVADEVPPDSTVPDPEVPATQADVAALQAAVDVAAQAAADAAAAAAATGSLGALSDITTDGDPSGSIPRGAGTLVTNGAGFEVVATSVATDATKRAAWIADTSAYAVPVLTSVPMLPAGTNGTAYAGHTFAATTHKGGGDVTFSIESGGTDATHLAGLTLNQTTGALTGTPNATGAFSFTVLCKDELGGAGRQNCSLQIAAAATPAFVLPTQWPGNPVAVGATVTLACAPLVQNFTGTVSYSSSSLPLNHFSINGTTGVITGAPLAADAGKTFAIPVTATNGAGTTIISTVQVRIAAAITINTRSFGNPTQSAAFPLTPISYTGGVAPVTFAVTAGTVPAGMGVFLGFFGGTPTTPGAYDFTVTATDASTPAVTVSQRYTGTVIAVSQPFAFVVPNGSLDAVLGVVKVGDKVDLPLAQFTSNAAGAITYDSGSPATLPSAGLDVNRPSAGHFGGTANIDGVIRPNLRANDGSGWVTQPCRLTLIKGAPGIDISTYLSNMTLGDTTTDALARQNRRTLIAAIAAAKASGKRLYSTQGTDGSPAVINVAWDAGTTGMMFQSGSPSVPGVAVWDLGNILFRLQPNQTAPANGSVYTLFSIQGVDQLRINLNVDANSGHQFGTGQVDAAHYWGTYGDPVETIWCGHQQGQITVYNGRGISGSTGSMGNGDHETFDIANKRSIGGDDLQITIIGKWNGDTNADYASGLATQNMQDYAGHTAERSAYLVNALRRRHGLSCFRGGQVWIKPGTVVDDCEHGLQFEAGSPPTSQAAITRPTDSVWIGSAGGAAVISRNCTRGNTAAGFQVNGNYGNPVREVIVHNLQSTGDAVPTRLDGLGAGTLTLVDNVIDTPVVRGGSDQRCCILATPSALPSLHNVAVSGTSTVHGLSGPKIRPSGEHIASGTWATI